jgi:F0F1-type ATP synthase membrane subunit b/b'
MNEQAAEATKGLIDYGVLGILAVLLIVALIVIYRTNDATRKLFIEEKNREIEKKDEEIERLRKEVSELRDYDEKILRNLVKDCEHAINGNQTAFWENGSIMNQLKLILNNMIERNMKM